jgi:hypothetical protein
MIIKIVPKAAGDPENCYEADGDMYTGENRPVQAQESRNRNSNAAFGTIVAYTCRYTESAILITDVLL